MRDRQQMFPGRVLIDTSAYYAFADRDDTFHPQSRAIFSRLANARTRRFTTSFVLGETQALLLARINRRIATQFLHDIHQGSTTLVWVTPSDVERATKIMDRYDDKEFSLTDATSFVVMEPLEIGRVFTFDDHFTQYGLTPLAPEPER